MGDQIQIEEMLMLCDRVASGNDSISRHDGERVDAFETMVKLGSFTKIRCRECGECIDMGRGVFCSMCGPSMIFCTMKCHLKHECTK
jgi:hypothetical protein